MRRAAAIVARAGYRAIRRTPLQKVTEARRFVRLRERLYAVEARDLYEILDALRAAHVPVWLVGGWGVDALLDGPIRPHWDIDLMVPDTESAAAGALRALATLGYERAVDGGIAGHWLPVRMVLRNRAGRTVDLLFVRPSPDAPLGPVGGMLAPTIDPDADVTVGSLDGRPVPCASASFQVRVHTGYVPAPHDRRDVLALCERFGVPLPAEYERPPAPPPPVVHRRRRVRTLVRRGLRRRGPATAVILPVPEADALGALTGEVPRPGALPAHLTVAYPFAPPSVLTTTARRTLRALAASTPGFTVSLASLGRFPGVLYAAPDDDANARAVALTEAIVAEWPAYPPYGGRFDTIVPHVTVYEGPAEPRDLEERARALLPIESTVRELWLVVQDQAGGWSVSERFPLGPAR